MGSACVCNSGYIILMNDKLDGRCVDVITILTHMYAAVEVGLTVVTAPPRETVPDNVVDAFQN